MGCITFYCVDVFFEMIQFSFNIWKSLARYVTPVQVEHNHGIPPDQIFDGGSYHEEGMDLGN